MRICTISFDFSGDVAMTQVALINHYYYYIFDTVESQRILDVRWQTDVSGQNGASSPIWILFARFRFMCEKHARSDGESDWVPHHFSNKIVYVFCCSNTYGDMARGHLSAHITYLRFDWNQYIWYRYWIKERWFGIWAHLQWKKREKEDYLEISFKIQFQFGR